MRDMLMMQVPRGSGDQRIGDWASEDFKAHIVFMHDLNKVLTDSGELVRAEGLARCIMRPSASTTPIGRRVWHCMAC